jgi:hypothetical protein
MFVFSAKRKLLAAHSNVAGTDRCCPRVVAAIGIQLEEFPKERVRPNLGSEDVSKSANLTGEIESALWFDSTTG